MLYKNLGQSGLEISVFSLGSWLTIGAALDNAASQKIMETAIEVGINFLIPPMFIIQEKRNWLLENFWKIMNANIF